MANILIVDDSEDLLYFLSELLKTNKFTVETALSIKEFKSKLPLFNPDLILLDVRFNGTDGRLLCKQLKAKSQHKHIPIILFSASPELLNEYAECEANDVIEKPFNIAAIIEKINNQLHLAAVQSLEITKG